MNSPRSLLHEMVRELHLLRSEGVERLSVSAETLTALRERFAGSSTSADETPSPPASTRAPGLSRGTAKQSSGVRGGDVPPSPEPLAAPGRERRVVATSRAEAGEAGAARATIPPPPTVSLRSESRAEQWEELRTEVRSCPVGSGQIRPGKQLVFGTGPLDAPVFFCGEAPGAEEEMQGEPFVGPAGQLLNGMIRAMGLRREEVYIGNILHWRPPTGKAYGNRPPTDEEMAYGLPYLRAQVDLVRPRAVVALGGTAARGLLGLETKGRMGQLRGSWHSLGEIPVMITYHPSYLLHHDSVRSKRKVWEDLLSVMETVSLPISEKQRNYFLSALGS
mgnify:CR=1 FL=1